MLRRSLATLSSLHFAVGGRVGTLVEKNLCHLDWHRITKEDVKDTHWTQSWLSHDLLAKHFCILNILEAIKLLLLLLL